MEGLLRAGSLRERAGLYAAFLAKDSHQAVENNRHQRPMCAALASQSIDFIGELSSLLAGSVPAGAGALPGLPAPQRCTPANVCGCATPRRLTVRSCPSSARVGLAFRGVTRL